MPEDRLLSALSSRCPFIIALNKVDRLYDWKETAWGPFQQTLDNQQDYVQEEGIDLKFAVQFRDLEDPELNNTPSTYLHMAIMPRNM